MDFKISTICLLFISLTSASIIPSVEVLQGPSSKTTLLGPDGSALDSAAPGGTVLTNAYGSGLVAAGPAILPLGTPIVVNGPAGSIATSHSLAGSALVPGIAPALAATSAIPAAPAILTGPSGYLGNTVLGNAGANEEAYVPDPSEALYDDGSYREGH